MHDPYTTMGEGGQFPQTTWSMVANLQTDAERARSDSPPRGQPSRFGAFGFSSVPLPSAALAR